MTTNGSSLPVPPVAASNAADKARAANPEVETILGSLGTETRNPNTYGLSSVSTLDMLTLINNEDATIAAAVKQVLPQLAKAVDGVSERMAKGGRLLYFGAGTSGRIGVLDASEILPTFGVGDKVIGVMAGGDYAIRLPVEGIEDDADAGVKDAKDNNVGPNDAVVGLSASGRAPYVLAVCDYARSVGALAIGVATNATVPLASHVDILINPVVGNEALTGSTRMKSGTAQKLVLNMLSTGSMIRLGKTYSNLMVDMKLANRKLEIRAARMVANAVGTTPEEGERLLNAANRETKTAIMMGAAGITAEEARQKLQQSGGVLSKALQGYALRPEAVQAAAGPGGKVSAPSNGEKLSSPGGEKVHLVIDGGGTKTLAVLVSANDPSKEFGRGTSGTTNLNAVAPSTVVDRVVEAGKAAAGGKPIEVVSAQLCFAGAGNKENTEKLAQHIVGRIVGDASNESKVKVLTDAELLLNAHPAGDGSALDVAVIAGTGSIAVARNKEGGLERTGGWGPLLGDLGAGYRVGLMAIKAITEDLDSGSAPEKKTSMTGPWMQANGLKVKADIVPFLYGKDITEQKAAIAAASKSVFDAAQAGDKVAQGILAKASTDLAEDVAMLCKRLNSTTCRLACGGGLLVNQPAYRQQLVDGIEKHGVKVSDVVVVDDPALQVAKVAAGGK